MFERLGAFLDGRRILDYTGMLLAAEIAISAYFVATSYNAFHNQTEPVTTDFVSASTPPAASPMPARPISPITSPSTSSPSSRRANRASAIIISTIRRSS